MWILKPPGFDAKKKWPVAFLVHGGPQGAWEDGWSFRWNPQLWAAQGYIVALPNPHSGTGFGQKFVDEISGDWGGKCYDDLMKCADYLESLPYVDKDRIGSAGGSFGGYMQNWFAVNTGRFKCLITHCSVWNFESMYATTDELWFDEWEHGGPPWGKNRKAYEKHSPHRYAANLKKFKTPMLVIHNDLDFRCPIGQGHELFTTLQRLGVPSRMINFPDEGHWVLKPANSRYWHREVFAWLKKYVPPGAGEDRAAKPNGTNGTYGTYGVHKSHKSHLVLPPVLATVERITPPVELSGSAVSHDESRKLLIGQGRLKSTAHQETAALQRHMRHPHQQRLGEPLGRVRQAHGQQIARLHAPGQQQTDPLHRQILNLGRSKILHHGCGEGTGSVGVDRKPLRGPTICWLRHNLSPCSASCQVPLPGHYSNRTGPPTFSSGLRFRQPASRKDRTATNARRSCVPEPVPQSAPGRIRMHRILFAVLSTLLFLPALLVAEKQPAPAKLKALLITGGGYHNYKALNPVLTKKIPELANVTFTVKSGLDILKNPKFADGYDVVVYNFCFADEKNSELIENALKATRDGKPTVMIHCAMHTFMASDDWTDCCGMRSAATIPTALSRSSRPPRIIRSSRRCPTNGGPPATSCIRPSNWDRSHGPAPGQGRQGQGGPRDCLGEHLR